MGSRDLGEQRSGREHDLARRTIDDFGEQWSHFQDNSGFFGSAELLADHFGPLLTPSDLAGRRVADIGAGAGRFVNVFLDSGAAHVVALEPSDAFFVLKQNTERREADPYHAAGTARRLSTDALFTGSPSHSRPTSALAPRRSLRPGGAVSAGCGTIASTCCPGGLARYDGRPHRRFWPFLGFSTGLPRAIAPFAKCRRLPATHVYFASNQKRSGW